MPVDFGTLQPDPPILLPGYTAMPSDGVDTYTLNVATIQARRMDGPFLVRGSNHTDYIEDGWLCQGADGTVFGVEDAVFAAQYSVVSYIFAVSAGANGAVVPSNGEPTVNAGDNYTITVVPDAGFHVDEVLVDGGAAVLTDSAYTFTNVTATHTFAVTFIAD